MISKKNLAIACCAGIAVGAFNYYAPRVQNYLDMKNGPTNVTLIETCKIGEHPEQHMRFEERTYKRAVNGFYAIASDPDASSTEIVYPTPHPTRDKYRATRQNFVGYARLVCGLF